MRRAAVTAGVVGGASVAALTCWLRTRLMVVSVTGRSMEPALTASDRVLVARRRPARLRIGDVVVLAPSDDARRLDGGDGSPEARTASWLVKRVAALPGDELPTRVPGRGDSVRVPAGHVVVLGDNESVSYDSRQMGPIGFHQLRGVVLRQLSTRPPTDDRSTRPAEHTRPVDRPGHTRGDSSWVP
ncbi:S26 family signal peptidase [Luteipulveratus flavus]|uniref:S26 family signal peptidase n=1 Tax=Luteipulveratus flavus TaxID=3031728 RepID=A0ABT6C4R7_9MICO|nr:S26 family signal peptidase [Luteipulveratus sp. YIM 133296]MDF8263943.1 S26 family signal peptidase [Luteipulveratus sp. YIM 133296]